jgi:hypothetical protein
MTTTEMTVADFCDIHGACTSSRKWALATGCATMAELWKRDDMRPDFRVWTATRRGVMGERSMLVFAFWSVLNLRHDDREHKGMDAARAAGRSARAAASADALVATCDATWDAARDAAHDAAHAAADLADARAAQAKWILANAKPNFEAAQ